MGQSANGRTAPVIFVPGYGQADRAWTLIGRHLDRAGFSDVTGVGPAGTRGDVVSRAHLLARHVEAALERSGSDSVHLVTHNVGGVVARYFVQLLDGHDAVDTVVTVGTAHSGSALTPVGLGPAAAQVRPGSTILARLDESARPLDVRWISYFSEQDLFVAPATSAMLKHPLLRTTNVVVSDHGHLSLVIPAVVCRSVAQQLAAAEGIPGFGAPVRSLPGGVVRLEDSLEQPGRQPSPGRVAAAMAVHPSNWSGPQAGTRRLRLA